ncbi:hypothetical protein GGS24DRAFT_507399 [Hypoxylon argillaceum]|nr:hypothetical protein GGS24DRAFT_507399 [Hypoxylon argillaceum]
MPYTTTQSVPREETGKQSPDSVDNVAHPQRQSIPQDGHSSVVQIKRERSSSEERSENTVEWVHSAGRSVVYTTDPFYGFKRRRRMMDDLYDRLKEEQPEKLAQYGRRYRRANRRARGSSSADSESESSTMPEEEDSDKEEDMDEEEQGGEEEDESTDGEESTDAEGKRQKGLRIMKSI